MTNNKKDIIAKLKKIGEQLEKTIKAKRQSGNHNASKNFNKCIF